MSALTMSKVRPAHLVLLAVLYLRQSKTEQVERNEGSTEYQRSIGKVLEELGWAPENIIVIDDDLGLSGDDTAHRPGYRRLVELITAGRVGILAAGDLSRIGRSAKNQLELLELCQIHNVLLLLGDRIYDATDLRELFMIQLDAVFAQFNNSDRRNHMQHGRIAKAKQGKRVARVAAGFVLEKQDEGRPRKDPDPAVQNAVQRVFEEFQRQGSIPRTVRALRRDGARIPARNGKRLRWADPKIHNVFRMLTNPIYAGHSRFRNTVVNPTKGRDAKGHWRVRPAQPEERIFKRNTHEGYVTASKWDEIQAKLHDHGRSSHRTRTTESPAIFQGLIRCPIHSMRLMTPKPLRKRKSGEVVYSYVCAGEHEIAGAYCYTIASPYIDGPGMEAILRRIAPPRISVLREEWERARKEERAEHYRLKVDLQLAREQEDHLEHLYTTESPNNAAARRRLASRWDEAIRERERIERTLAASEAIPSIFDDPIRFDELVALATDAPRLLQLPTTTSFDRKDLARMVIESIIVEKVTPEEIVIRIIWADGSEPEICRVLRWGHAEQIVLQLHAEGISKPAIAEILNTQGILTRKLRAWTSISVERVLERLTPNGKRRRRCP